MSAKLEALSQNLQDHLGERIASLQVALGEITIDVGVDQYLDVMQTLRDEPELGFEQLMDLCGVDYSTYKDGAWSGARFAAVSHLVSIANNWRLRVRCFAANDDFPSVPSLVHIWNSVGWFEREAFIPTCGESLLTMVLWGIPSARISRSRVMSRCVTTPISNASFISR